MKCATLRSANPDMGTLDQDVEMLRTIPLFSGLPTGRLKLIAFTGEIVRFEPGEVIVQQGKPADAVYVIAEGEAETWFTRTASHLMRLREVLSGEGGEWSKSVRLWIS